MNNLDIHNRTTSGLARGNSLFLRGNYEKAVEEYQAALERAPDFFLYYENIGWCYERLNDYYNAQKFYNKALGLNPNSIRANLFINEDSKLENGTIKRRPLFFPQIHEAATTVDKKSLQDEYFEKRLHLKKDDFALIRIIGNDLYPRHKIGQSRENVAFILENEKPLERCRKIWIVNRIFDKEEMSHIISLLDKHNQEYYVIPFIEEEYKAVGLDYACLPSPEFLHSNEFEELSTGIKQRALISLLRLKNNYVMNNNGARNYALELGKKFAKWVLPWDGNCFMNKSSWNAVVTSVIDKPYLKHFVVPMARITSNDSVLNDEYVPEATEEPQIIIRCDSREEFNAEFSYGRRPKVELFWRLGIPGSWDTYNDDQWDLPRLPLSPEANQFGIAGWTARLFSGMAEQETQNFKGSANRNSARQVAIISTIIYIDKKNGLDYSEYTKFPPIAKQTASCEVGNFNKPLIEKNNKNFGFVSNRNDGLGERLKAMLNAIVMSNNFGKQFHVFWPNEVSAGKEFHAIDSKNIIFSKDYVKEKFIEEDFFSRMKIAHLSDIKTSKDLESSDEDTFFICHQNEKFPFLMETGGIKPAAYREAFNSIKFSDSIKQSILAAKNINLGKKAAAIHIRGGDIIYGRYRLSQRYQAKAISFPLAIALIHKLKQHGFTPVIFLQDKAIEDLLKHENISDIILARDYSYQYDSTEQAFFEIMLMSRCQTILAGTSGFAELAARIAGIKVKKVQDYLTHEESISAFKRWLPLNELVDNFQHSFVLLNYVLLGEAHLSAKEIDDALKQAEANDPENSLYRTKRILNLWKNNDFLSANKLIEEYFNQFQSTSLKSMPILHVLSANARQELAMQKYFNELPSFEYAHFQELGIIFSYIKFLTNGIASDNECINFLNQMSLQDNSLAEHAKYIIILIG
jgi:tetratricopeptide (TPR) repeat protein